MISEAFPDFDLSTLPPIPSDWRDVSWRHDLCPSWLIDGLQIYVAHADPTARDGAERFHILDGDTGDALLSTDAWADVLNYVHMVTVALPDIPDGADEDQLVAVYDQFLAVTGLPAMSADELIFETVPPAARHWITRFIEAWEQMREDEKEWMKYAEQKAGIR